MATKVRLSPLQTAVRSVVRPARCQQRRCFSSSPECLTDGVFKGLTAMRTKIPFIEAFKRQQEAAKLPAQDVPQEPRKPVDLSPKRMSDSYHKVVSLESSIP
jgi:acyl-coenzyme A thioesterase 9